MRKKIAYIPKGVCSRKIDLEIQEGVIVTAHFTGGCAGNALGIEKLVCGQNAAYVMETLKGTTCGGKETSCPDQLSKAIAEILGVK